jgi:hypothetical protein
MIELIVAMVLLAIVIALVGDSFLRAVSGAEFASSGAASDAAIARAVGKFQDDLAVTETADRTARLVREQASLDAALRQGVAAPSDDPTINRAVDLEDVLQATPTLVQLQADVDRARAGAECVTWRATTSGDRYEVTRTVQGQGCAGASETEVVFKGAAQASGAVTQPFSYRLMCNRSVCGAASQAPSSSPCATWVQTTVNGAQRRWITAVQAQFVANTGRSGTNGKSGVSMNIRSRHDHMWKTALGC